MVWGGERGSLTWSPPALSDDGPTSSTSLFQQKWCVTCQSGLLGDPGMLWFWFLLSASHNLFPLTSSCHQVVSSHFLLLSVEWVPS